MAWNGKRPLESTREWESLFGGLEWTTGILEWNTGMEYWNGLLEWTTGILEWNTGMDYWNDGLLERPTHYVFCFSRASLATLL